MLRRPPLLALALVAGLVASVPTPPAAGKGDPVQLARHRLAGDSHGQVTLESTTTGALRFVGTGVAAAVDNPSVGRGSSASEAARAHLDRYGAALGAARGSRFVQVAATRAPSGVDVVRFRQSVSGVPVLGADVVVGLGAGHELRSLAADVAPAVTVTEPAVPASALRRTALAVSAREHPDARLRVQDLGRWVLDPTVAGLDLPGGVRTVRRLEVADGGAVRDMVLVDDHTGAVVVRTSLIENLDRLVCDRANVRGDETPCTTGARRTETSGPSGDPDVDDAFDLAGATAQFYEQIAGVDLTALLGVDVDGVPKLASTVNFCPTTTADPCPYANAFWDGTQMFYGHGFAGADDVVAHEMTHGFIDQYSALFYWGQSGAINESLADVIGEIVDHRHASTGDGPDDWDLGEDLPGGALRSLADPTLHGQPDSMTSTAYTADATYVDNGGVHTNSGVGNKTAYLISQGGTLNGHTVTGIDAGDPTLAKTARLYVAVIEQLRSGSDYADLARVLDQTCADFVTTATAGFTAGNCTSVHEAGLATALGTTPTNAFQPADASASCPDGTVRRVLLDGETDPDATMTHSSRWTRATVAGDRNATSGTSSWFAGDVSYAASADLSATSYVTIPEGQPTYLWFQRWQLLDYDGGTAYDGGVVRIETPSQTVDQAPVGAWINGPNATLASGYGNPWGGRPAFGKDSRGWVASRQDLSAYAGQQVRPHFILATDSDYGFIGWYLDDITIYTCDPAVPGAVQSMTATGILDGVTVRWQPPSEYADKVTGYWVGDGLNAVELSSAARSHTFRFPRAYTQLVITVETVSSQGPVAYRQVTVRRPYVVLGGTRSGDRVRFHGYLRAAGHGLGGRTVRLQRWTSTGWATVISKVTRADGTYAITLTRRARKSYRTLFPGSPGRIGTVSATRYR